MEKKTPYNPNNKTELPLNHYLERFRAGEPEEMSARTGAAWDGEKFTLRICGEEKREPFGNVLLEPFPVHLKVVDDGDIPVHKNFLPK